MQEQENRQEAAARACGLRDSLAEAAEKLEAEQEAHAQVTAMLAVKEEESVKLQALLDSTNDKLLQVVVCTPAPAPVLLPTGLFLS